MSGLPLEALVQPGLELDDGGKRVRSSRSVVVLADLWASVTKRLRERGAQLSSPGSIRELVTLLAERDVDAVIIDLANFGAGALVKWLKEGPEVQVQRTVTYFEDLLTRQKVGFDADAERAIAARERHRLTPFYVVLEAAPHYGIVVQRPEHSYYETGAGISLADAVMSLDVGKLLLRGSALA